MQGFRNYPYNNISHILYPISYTILLFKVNMSQGFSPNKYSCDENYDQPQQRLTNDFRLAAERRAKALQDARDIEDMKKSRKQNQTSNSNHGYIVSPEPSPATAHQKSPLNISSVFLIDASDVSQNTTPNEAKLNEKDYLVNGGRARCDSDDFTPPRIMLDQETDKCTNCYTMFDLFNRKHHCRHCGKIFCENCSCYRALLPYEYRISDPQRVCIGCNRYLTPKQSFLTMSIANHQKVNSIDITSCYQRYANSPISFSLDAEIRKAAYSSFNLFNMDWVPDKSIPLHYLSKVWGMAFITIAKGGFGLGFKIGTGLVISRLPDGAWSAPSAIATVGVSWGALAGLEISDYVIFLNTIEAVKAFAGIGQLSVGAGIELAVGPMGRSGTADMNFSTTSMAPAYSYSHSRGLYAGISLDGAVIATRTDVNYRFYGRSVTPLEILGGQIPPPRAAQPLYDALQTAINSSYRPHYPHQAPS